MVALVGTGHLAFWFSIIILSSGLLSAKVGAQPVSMVCPCTVETINQTKAVVNFSIAFHKQVNESGPLKFQLTAQLYKDIWTSSYVRLGETDIESLPYSSQAQAVSLSVPIERVPASGFITGVLFGTDNSVLDRIQFTEGVTQYNNPGGSIPFESNKLMFNSAVEFEYNSTDFTLRIPSISNESLRSVTETLVLKIAVVDDARSGYLLSEGSVDVTYDAAGETNIDITGPLPAPLNNYPGYDNVYMFIERNGDRILEYLLVTLPSGSSSDFGFTLGNIDAVTDSDGDGMSDYNERLLGTNPTQPNSFDKTLIEVAFTYGSSLEGVSSGEAEIDAAIAFYLGQVNQWLTDMALKVRLVNVGNYDVGDDSALNVDNVIETMGSRQGVFNDLEGRLSRLPDILIHATSLAGLNGTLGIAPVNGIFNDGIIDFESLYSLGKNVTAVVLDEDQPGITLLHEIGHIIGLGHARRQYSSTPKATFPWAVGYGVDNNFGTLMSYAFDVFSAGQLPYLSSPNVAWGGVAIGLSRGDYLEGADAKLAFRTTALQISGISNGITLNNTIDSDGDGFGNDVDAFPSNPTEWLDADSDGIGNNADTDDDNDGVSDAMEISLGRDPLDANDGTGSPREIFWRNAENGQNVLWSMETQHLVARNVVNIVHDSRWKVIGLADFTGDGQDEVLFRHANGDNRVWTMVNGQRVSSDTITGAHSDWFVAALGDFDADGDADLFWRNQETGAIRYWEMDGLIRLSSLAVRSVPLDWKVAGSGDFDGDGRNDLLWRHSTGANVIWLMESEEIATRSQIRGVDPVWEVSGIGDFDGDGMDDIFWQHPSTGNNSIWLLNGAELKSRHSLPKTSVGWRAFGVLDMNGDSFADILLRHNVYGSNRLWLMNGTTRTHSLGVGGVPDLNWEPVAVGNTP
jgi:hypothetical protein